MRCSASGEGCRVCHVRLLFLSTQPQKFANSVLQCNWQIVLTELAHASAHTELVRVHRIHAEADKADAQTTVSCLPQLQQPLIGVRRNKVPVRVVREADGALLGDCHQVFKLPGHRTEAVQRVVLAQAVSPVTARRHHRRNEGATFPFAGLEALHDLQKPYGRWAFVEIALDL